MAIVPKKAAATAKVHQISEASGGGGKRRGGRPSGLGYDPATGEEMRGATYRETATRDSAAEFDVFTLVNDKGYREDRFYTRSVNADGHGEKLQLRVPQGLDSQMHAAVSEIAEYKTMQDLVRDAVVHRLEYLQKRYSLGEGARRMIELERMQADRERRAQETETMQKAVEDLDAKFQGLNEKQDWAMLAEEFSEAGEMVDWLRDPYKTRAVEVIEKWKSMTTRQIAAMLERREKE